MTWPELAELSRREPARAHEEILGQFYRVWRGGAEGRVSAFLSGLDIVLNEAKSGEPDVVSQWVLLRRLAATLKEHEPAAMRGLIDGSKHGRTIVEHLAERESAGEPAQASHAELRALLKVESNTLSMALRTLVEGTVLTQTKDGRVAYVSLGRAGRVYAIEQGWLKEEEIRVPDELYRHPAAKGPRGFNKRMLERP